tara:strand:+ start:786 stop:992 length:207 start_codon:yes stop_codon:yes gene_type:complete
MTTNPTMFNIKGKDYTHSELNLIREFFTDIEWDAIESAMAEYQDHGEEATDLMHSVTDKIYDVMRMSY